MQWRPDTQTYNNTLYYVIERIQRKVKSFYTITE